MRAILINRFAGRPKITSFFLALFLLVLMLVQLVHLCRATSITWDEGHHLFDGYTVWKQADYRLNPEVPPLVKLVAALPLLRSHLEIPANQQRGISQEAFLDGRAFIFGNGGDRVLFPARMACAAFTLLLGLLLYSAASELFGRAAGLFCLALFIFDPNFLAHGALVTTDVGSACLFLAASYAWFRYSKATSPLSATISGPTRSTPGLARHLASFLLVALATGLALVAKFTGILVLPLLLLLAGLEALQTRSLPTLGRRCAALAGIALLAWIVLWSFYGFRYEAAPHGEALKPTLAQHLAAVPERRDAATLGRLAHARLLPEAYLWGLADTKITENADTSYFFGHVYRHGNWKYFPAAFLIKSTLPLLLLLCVVPLALRYGFARGRLHEAGFLLLPICLYLFVVMRSDMNIGLRHLLPIYPFLYILAAGAAATLLRSDKRWAVLFAALLCWQAATSLRSAPGYMAYANEAWGGQAQVHRYLSDANDDWGQQLKEVKQYLDRRGIQQCWFAYFPDGVVEPADYGIPCKRLPTTETLWWLNLPMQVPPVIEGTVLISDSDLEGIEFGQGALNPYEAFRHRQPSAVIQGGLFVYDGSFAVPLASALVGARNAQQLLARGRQDEALGRARQAVALAPQAVTAQLALGDVLVSQGVPREAAAHYDAALQAARTIEPSLQSDLVPGIANKLEQARASGSARR